LIAFNPLEWLGNCIIKWPDVSFFFDEIRKLAEIEGEKIFGKKNSKAVET